MLKTSSLLAMAILGLGNANAIMPPLFSGLQSPLQPNGNRIRDRRGPGQSPNQGHFASKWPTEGARAVFRDNNHTQAKLGWLDRHGLPHGRSGDKLARRARRGMVGVCHPKAKV